MCISLTASKWDSVALAGNALFNHFKQFIYITVSIAFTMLKKTPNFQVWVPRTNVFKSSLGPTNTESGWKLVNSQIYMSSPDIVLITVLQLLYVFNVIYLLVCLLTLCLPIFSFPQHILNSKSYKERNLICSVLCPWHLEEYLAHNRPSINAC